MFRFLAKNALALALCGSVSAWATVGGDVRLKVLGYEPVDQKVYVLHDYEDGLGGYRLHYFDLKSQNPSKMHEAVSYYAKSVDEGRGGTGNENDDEEWGKLNALQKRLTSLTPTLIKDMNIVVDSLTGEVVEHEHVPEWTRTKYYYHYHVTQGNYQSQPQTAISYYPELTITQAYQIPKHDTLLVAVEYLDEPMETGYTIEDPIILTPKSEKTAPNNE